MMVRVEPFPLMVTLLVDVEIAGGGMVLTGTGDRQREGTGGRMMRLRPPLASAAMMADRKRDMAGGVPAIAEIHGHRVEPWC